MRIPMNEWNLLDDLLEAISKIVSQQNNDTSQVNEA